MRGGEGQPSFRSTNPYKVANFTLYRSTPDKSVASINDVMRLVGAGGSYFHNNA